RNAAGAMDHRDRGDRPAARRLARDPFDRFLGHPRVMFEFEGDQPSAFVAADAGEGNHRPGIAGARLDPRDLGAEVEVFRLHAEADVGRHRYPPVIGGNRATSRVPAIAMSLAALTRSRAMRTAAGSDR